MINTRLPIRYSSLLIENIPFHKLKFSEVDLNNTAMRMNISG